MIFTALAVSLMLTLVLEMGFLLLVGKRNKKDLLLAALVNIITNPVVVLVYWLLYDSLNPLMLKVALELFAIAVEGYYYQKYGQSFRRPYLFSAAANALSFGAGTLLQMFI